MRVSSLFATLLLSLALASWGCGSSASTSDSGQAPPPSDGRPELSEETIIERINGVNVNEIPDEAGVGQPIHWRFFFREEPKEIVVIEKKIDGDRATVVLDIKTQTGPRAREPRQLAGQIRTEWELKTGWVLRRWEVVDAENISMKYKNLPKPVPTNSNNNSDR
jgi:hypothetical protein